MHNTVAIATKPGADLKQSCFLKKQKMQILALDVGNICSIIESEGTHSLNSQICTLFGAFSIQS